MQFKVSILLIVYNRPDLTSRVLEAIGKVKPTHLYICADGPRTDKENDQINCAAVRALFEKIDWPCEVKRLFHPTNLGVALSPRTGLRWFFEKEREGIILEDDCLPGLDFFPFCEQLLEKYRNNPKIFTINGGNLGYKNEKEDSYSFSRFMNMTGWATWRRTALSIDYDLLPWQATRKPYFYLYKLLRVNLFDFDIKWVNFWKYFFDRTVAKDNVKWWDYLWIFNQLNKKQFSIVPSTNLVTNIGFGPSASNTFDEYNPAANIPAGKLRFPLKHPDKIIFDKYYEEKYVKEVWCDHKRISTFLWVRTQVKKYLVSITK